MKSIKFFIPVFSLLMITSFISCQNKGGALKSPSTKDNLKSSQNDSVQYIFYDTPFGASKEEVLNNFKKRGLKTFYAKLKIDEYDDMLCFSPKKFKHFTFGGLKWHAINVYFKNGRFCSIRFLVQYNNKEEAVTQYYTVENRVSQKYNLSDGLAKESTDSVILDIRSLTTEPQESEENQDSNIYFHKYKVGCNGCTVNILCGKNALSKTDKYDVYLKYDYVF